MRSLVLVFLLVFSLKASEVNIYSNDIKKKGDIISANSGVIVISPLYYISAKRAVFHEKTKLLELFGDVSIIRGENERSISSYTSLNLSDDSAVFKDFFFANTQLEVWLRAKKSCYKGNVFSANDSVVSSCNVNNPDWKIKFKKGDLNKKTGMLSLYDAKLYIKNVPIFYLPYFAFSTSTKRSSGLLIPRFSIQTGEGFFYKQPIYWAIDNNSDLLFKPQIRTNRGLGITTEYRYVDDSSNLRLDLGFFNDKSSYTNRENLKNKSHYGANIKYSQSALIKKLLQSDKGVQEGLWIDATYLNDIDYLNLSDQSNDFTSLVTSKLNYFLATNTNYLGIYARHYIDTAKLSNKDTLQEYPSFQYHRFLNKILLKDLYYNFDANFRNYYRRDGLKARQMEMLLPISYQKSFLNDFLNIKLTQSIYANLINYSRYKNKQEDLVQTFHELSFYTQLARRYDSFSHTMDMSLNYFLPGLDAGGITQDFLKHENDKKNINTKFSQYFYNELGQKKLRHMMMAKYLIGDDNKNLDFANELDYFLNENISFKNELNYNGQNGDFDKVFTSINYDTQKANIALNHAYRIYEDKRYNYLGTTISYKVDRNYDFDARLYYDLVNKDATIWSVGYTYRRKCWSYSLAYRVSTDPKLTSAGINAKRQKGVYFIFNFYPIGGVSYDFAVEEHENKI